MNFCINKKTLKLDLFDVDVAEAMEKAILHTANEMIALGEKEQSYLAAMKEGCHIVFAFFDRAFGAGTAKELFGERHNYKLCLKAYLECSKQYKKFMTEGMAEELKELHMEEAESGKGL